MSYLTYTLSTSLAQHMSKKFRLGRDITGGRAERIPNLRRLDPRFKDRNKA